MSACAIVLFILLLGTLFIGLPVAILWIRDHGGIFGRLVGYCIAVTSLALGLALAGWFTYGFLYGTGWLERGSDNPLRFGMHLVLAWSVAAVFAAYGFHYIFRPGAGIEEQEIDFDSPEFSAAKKQARDTLGFFTQKASEHVDGAFIKFPLVTADNLTEHIWGYVHHYGNGKFNVSVANDTFATREHGMRMDVSEDDVEDWQIMLPDGTIKGAFSVIGVFRYLERKGRRLNRTMRKQKQALLDFNRPFQGQIRPAAGEGTE